ncbi:hypothetical protein Droror1_Dr00025051, partial [Drosera rotundifolia]
MLHPTRGTTGVQRKEKGSTSSIISYSEKGEESRCSDDEKLLEFATLDQQMDREGGVGWTGPVMWKKIAWALVVEGEGALGRSCVCWANRREDGPAWSKGEKAWAGSWNGPGKEKGK